MPVIPKKPHANFYRLSTAKQPKVRNSDWCRSRKGNWYLNVQHRGLFLRITIFRRPSDGRYQACVVDQSLDRAMYGDDDDGMVWDSEREARRGVLAELFG